MLILTITSLVVALVSIIVAFYMMIRINRNNDDKEVTMLREELKKLREENALQFKVIASDTLNQNAGLLRGENLRQLETVLNPLKTKIDDFSKDMRDSYLNSMATSRSLQDHLERMMRLNVSIGDEARKLSEALKGNSKVQGDWGELLLETILEKEGLIKGEHFDTQVTRDVSGAVLRDESGAQRRPDAVVYLPGNHSLIIDSKTSLSAYIDYCDEDDAEIRKSIMKKHVDSVKKHIDELYRVEYPKLIKSSAEYVIMFIPNDGALMLALKADQTLRDYASRKKIVLASPTYLMTILHLTAQLWREDSQSKNAAEIARVAGLLYDKVSAFVNDMKNVEKSISAADTAYKNAYSKLVNGNQSVISRAERLRNLGAKVQRRINEDVVSDTILDGE